MLQMAGPSCEVARWSADHLAINSRFNCSVFDPGHVKFGSRPGRGGDRSFDLGELLGRAELNQFGAFLGFGGVAGRHVERVARSEGLFVIVVANDDTALDDVASVRASAPAGWERGEHRRQVV